MQKTPPPAYRFPEPGTEELKARPVVAGFGPAGIFAAYMLALHGYRPLVIERGSEAQQRKADVEAFWETGVLDTPLQRPVRGRRGPAPSQTAS